VDTDEKPVGVSATEANEPVAESTVRTEDPDNSNAVGGKTNVDQVVVSAVVLVAGQFTDSANAAIALARVADVFAPSQAQLITEDKSGSQSIYVGPLSNEKSVKDGIAALRELGFKRILIKSAPTASADDEKYKAGLAGNRTQALLPYWIDDDSRKHRSVKSHIDRDVLSEKFLAKRDTIGAETY